MNPLKTLALILIAGGWPVSIIAAFFRLPDAVMYVGFALALVGVVLFATVSSEEKKARAAGSSSVKSSSEQQNR